MQKTRISCLFLLMLSFFSGNLFTQNVGIGTAAPAEKLHVSGNIRSDNLAGTSTRLVGADVNGTLTVVTPGGTGQVLTQSPGGPIWYRPRSTPVHVNECCAGIDYLVNCNWIRIWTDGNSSYAIHAMNTAGVTLKLVYSLNNGTPISTNITNGATYTFTPNPWFRNANEIHLQVSSYSNLFDQRHLDFHGTGMFNGHFRGVVTYDDL